jgi:lysozyme family protein
MIDSYLEDLIIIEGGFTSDSRDSAHKLRVKAGDKWDSYCTKYGITQFTLSEFYDRQATYREVRQLTKSKAKEIYLRNYFYRYKINHVNSKFQLLMLDMVVQHKYAIRIIQQTINQTDLEVKVDNLIGPNTLKAINILCSRLNGYFINMVNYNRVNYYDSLGKNNKWAVGGWLKRAEKFIVIPNKGSEFVLSNIKNVKDSYGIV